MMELFTKQHRVFYSSFYMCLDSGINIITAIYYSSISNNWIYLTSIGYVLQFVSGVTGWLLPESPIWFLNKNRAHKAIPSLELIAKVNGKKLVFNPKDFKKPRSNSLTIESPNSLLSNLS